jgi:hypothetical protein
MILASLTVAQTEHEHGGVHRAHVERGCATLCQILRHGTCTLRGMVRGSKHLLRGLLGHSLLVAIPMTACAGHSSDEATGATTIAGGGAASDAGGDIGAGGTAGTDGGGPKAEPFWPDVPLSEFHAPACVPGTGWLAVHGLNPATPVDYVALRLSFGVQGGRDGGTLEKYDLDANGTPCAGASDQATCLRQLDQAGSTLTVSEFCDGPPHPCQHYLAATNGDTVETYTPGQGYLDFLGAIDTAAEALLVVGDGTSGGYRVTADPVYVDDCATADLASVREVADGYEVVAEQMVASCSPIVDERVLVHVSRDGKLTELRRNVGHVSSACF